MTTYAHATTRTTIPCGLERYSRNCSVVSGRTVCGANATTSETPPMTKKTPTRSRRRKGSLRMSVAMIRFAMIPTQPTAVTTAAGVFASP